jgi:ferric iron reductase protein FhuF
MLASFAAALPESLAWYRDKLVLPGAAVEAVPGAELLEGDGCERLLARFAAVYPGCDRRALVSMWTQWHFGALLIPATAALVLCGRDLPLELGRVSIVPQESGLTAAIVMPDEGGEPAGDLFGRLFDGHVAPLIDHLAERFRVSPRLLWTNAASIFEWTLQQLPAERLDAQALSCARLRLERQCDALGRRNPMLGAVSYPLENGEPVRRRKLCCLRYLLTGVADCGSLCPLNGACVPALAAH